MILRLRFASVFVALLLLVFGEAATVNAAPRARPATTARTAKLKLKLKVPGRQASNRSHARPTRLLRTLQKTRAPQERIKTESSAASKTRKSQWKGADKRSTPQMAKGRLSSPPRTGWQAKRGPLRTATRAGRLVQSIESAIARLKKSPTALRIIEFYVQRSAGLTRKLDAWQARVPVWLATTMNTVRTYTLPSVLAFAFSRIERDKVFLGRYFAATTFVSYGVLPVAMSIGLSTAVSVLIKVATTPISAVVLVLRRFHLQRLIDRKATLTQSAKDIGELYVLFAKARRSEISSDALALAAH